MFIENWSIIELIFYEIFFFLVYTKKKIIIRQFYSLAKVVTTIKI